jgi:hypothetical protein
MERTKAPEALWGLFVPGRNRLSSLREDTADLTETPCGGRQPVQSVSKIRESCSLRLCGFLGKACQFAALRTLRDIRSPGLLDTRCRISRQIGRLLLFTLTTK